MNRYIKVAGAVLLFFVVSLSDFVDLVPAEVGEPSATVIYADGYVDVKYAGTDRFVPLVEGKTVGKGDLIETGTEGEVELLLPDKSVVKIGPSSLILVKALGIIEVTKVATSTFELIKGKIRAVVAPLMKKDSRFIIETTNATVGVRGTDFGETYDPDTETTYLLALEDCVSLSLSLFPGSIPFNVCAGNSMTIAGGEAPTPPSEESPGLINQFLREMEIRGGEGKPPAGARKPPYITGIFIGRTINLEEIDGSLTLSGDDVSIDRTAVVKGTAADDSGKVSLVEVSLDGGMTWKGAAGTEKWSFEFTPREDVEYTLMVRATNDAGLVSDPNDIGPWTVVYRDVGYEQIVRTFLERFIAALRTEDISTIDEIVSDGYDGSVGGFFSKDEMIQDGFEDLIGVLGGMTITYTLDQVSASGDKIVGVTHWALRSGTIRDEGRTRWWLSKSDDFRLVHAEGDWFFVTTAGGEPGLTLEVFNNGSSPPCDNSVRILLTVPNVPDTVATVTVQAQTTCGPSNIFLYRTYYESYTGKTYGFGGEFPVESMISACVPTCGIAYQPLMSRVLSCDFSGYGYNLTANVMLP